MGKGRIRKGLTAWSVATALINPLGGPSHSITSIENGYTHNTSGHYRETERNRRGKDVRNGTNDRSNRRRGNNQRFDYDPW